MSDHPYVFNAGFIFLTDEDYKPLKTKNVNDKYDNLAFRVVFHSANIPREKRNAILLGNKIKDEGIHVDMKTLENVMNEHPNSKLQIRTIHKKDYKPYTLKGSSDKLWFLNDHDEFSIIHENFDPLKTPVLVIGEGNSDRTNAVEIVGRPGMYVAGM